MKIRPVYNHIIVKKVIREAVSTGGIILTSTGEDNTTHAEVLAIGPNFKSEVAIGDVITYIEGDSRIHSEKIDNEDILIMPEECILGVVSTDE